MIIILTFPLIIFILLVFLFPGFFRGLIKLALVVAALIIAQGLAHHVDHDAKPGYASLLK